MDTVLGLSQIGGNWGPGEGDDNLKSRIGHLITAAALIACATSLARADGVADFYRGKVISNIVGFGTGGGYDLYARLVARHLGRHIPGNPSFSVRNMPGAGSRIAGDFVSNVAPQDGTVLGFLTSATVVDQLLDTGESRFDAQKLTWIGRLNDIAQVAVVWHTAPALSVEEATKTEVVLAASSPLNLSATLPLAFNRMVGTRFKVIPGYTTDMVLAMQRGETHGVGGTSWEPLKVTYAHLLKQNQIRILYMMGIERHRDLPDVPSLPEFGRTDADRQVFRLLGSISDIGRSIVTGPRVPQDRVQALRLAVAAMIKDPAFIAESSKIELDINFLPGTELQTMVQQLMASPKTVIDRAKAVTAPQR
jgi:tripartite-type tricarboxylate transporter receptor subunit TctC